MRLFLEVERDDVVFFLLDGARRAEGARLRVSWFLHSVVVRRASAAAREQAAVAAEQRQRLFDQSAHGKAAHRSQVKMRQQTAAEDRQADQRVQDWNS